MDQAIRNKLRSVVTQCRRLLEESIGQQLQGKYDIYATGKKDEVKAEDDMPLGHLTDEERQARQDILAHFKHIEALGHKRKETLEQLIREIAFTHLNRLCAYKMMEVRDVYVGGQRFREAVSKGLKSQGFLFYLADHPDDEKRYSAGDQEGAYRSFLNWLGGTLSQEIGVLFSPTDPANRVYPPQRVLDEVLDLLNSEELKGIWSEDETIGWVYQYFTPKELRDQARKESQAPRNSYELAFRNQFFTPRYVVEFLTDNTLGRIWYEMRKGNTKLKNECRYMVRRPGEVFFSEYEDEPGSPVRVMRELLLGGTEETFPEFRVGDVQPLIELAHTVDGYERHPIENASDPNWWPWATFRQIESSEDISGFTTQDLLDVLFIQVRGHHMTGGYGDLEPVCYRVANEVRRRCLEGRKEDATQEQLLRAITAIPNRSKKDPREIKILDPACGSGHFLLYCFGLLPFFYEEAYDDPDLGAGLQADYPTKDDSRRAVPGLILRHNLHGIDIDLRCTQIAALALWLRCQRAYQEMGLKKERPQITRSNIVVAERMPGEKEMLREFVRQLEPKLLGQLVEVVFDKMKLAGQVGSLLRIEEEIQDEVAEARRQWRVGPVATQMRLFGETKPVERQERFDLSGVTDAQFFERAEAHVQSALSSYVEHSENGDGQWFQRRLFADDAAQGLAFLEVLLQRFDVVLMNPPFGECSQPIEKPMRTQWDSLANDIYVLFVVTWSSRLLDGGYLGAITSRGFMLGRDQRSFRPLILGEGASNLNLLIDLGLDVLDTAAVETCAYVLSQNVLCQPDRTALFLDCRKAQRNSLDNLLSLLPSQPSYCHAPHTFLKNPQSTLMYSATEDEIGAFSTSDMLEPAFGKVTKGLNTSCDERFIRLMWEVNPAEIHHRWQFCAKGADYQWFMTNITTVIDWAENGRLIREHTASVSDNVAQAYRSSKYYFKAALTYTYRCSDFSLRALPEGCIFTNAAPVIVASTRSGAERNYLGLLAAFISERYERLLSHISKKGKYETGLIGRLPSPEVSPSIVMVSKWNELKDYLLYMESTLETSPYFVSHAIPSALSLDSEKLAASIRAFAHCSQLKPSETFIGRAVRGFTDRYQKANSWPHSLLSYLVGVCFGRWDVRRRLSHDQFADTSAFSALASRPPGSLVYENQGDASGLQDSYPADLAEDGIMVDDPEHARDIVALVRGGMEVLWSEGSAEIETQVYEALEIAEMRFYFKKPNGFWNEHVKRYTGCFRKAPTYWLLQSSEKNYALWIYYHRLDKDILFKALLNYVEPKIRREENRLDELRSQKAVLGPAAKGAKKLDKDIDRQDAFLSELRDFEEKLRRAANLHLDPDLNDGVVLNIAPLRELVPWKEAKTYWDDLMEGKYEWSSIGKQLREKGLVK